jgi:hypothetical protein
VIQDFTHDKEALTSALNAMETKETSTALNQAIFESVTMLSVLPSSRRAVIVLTDIENNTDTVSVSEAINKAQEARVPVHIIGFGPKIKQPDTLHDMAGLTGGQAYILTSPDQIRNRLQTVGLLLRQGYKVTFQSGLKADNAEHDLSILVTYQTEEGQAEGRFVAMPGEVTVIPSIDSKQVLSGQTVGGMVNFTAQPTAPAPIASVEYLLDGQPLITMVDPPYSFDWDSTTVETGKHILTVKAMDEAGNEGRAEVSLNVVLPMVVTASAVQSRITLGDEVTVEAEVQALAEVSRVELLMDGKSLVSDDTPPYRFSFDSREYRPGEHIITVRAVDTLGRGNEDSLNLQILPPPLSDSERRLLMLAAIGAIVATIIIAVIVLTIIVRAQRKKLQKRCRLEISNMGNVRSRYELQAEDATGALKLRFAHAGTNLSERQVLNSAETTEVAEAVEVTEVAEEVVEVDKPTPTRSRVDLGRVKQTAGLANRLNDVASSVSASLGALLPGSAGARFRDMSKQMRKTRSDASRSVRVPKVKLDRAQNIRSRLTGAMPTTSRRRGQVSPAKEKALPPTAQPERRITSVAQVAHSIVEHWAQTPCVEPGEVLTVDLLIDPVRPHQTQRCSFKVISRAAEQKDAPLVMEDGSIQIAGISWFRLYLPALIFGAVTAIAILSIVFLMINSGLLGQ